MILSESTPRRLGGWGMLGLFGLAAVMLPVNATWAQKAEEPQKVEAVVKSVEDLSRTTEGASRIQADPFEWTWTMERVTALDDAPKGSVIVRLKSDNSSDVLVSGSIEQAIVQFKKLIGEIEKKSSLAEKDEKRRKVLHEAIEILADLAPRLKSSEGHEKSGGGAGQLMLVIRADGADSPKKPLSKGEKAEIEALRAQVKKLNGELKAKEKELAEAQARLAKLQGLSPDAPQVLGSSDEKVTNKSGLITRERGYTVVRPVEKGAGSRYVTVRPVERGVRREVDIVRLETRSTDEKSPKTGVIKKVDPTKPRVEGTIGSDDGLVEGHKLTIHPSAIGAVKVPQRSDQQRIEELEKKLKELLDEVSDLKKGNSQGASAN